MALLQNVFSWSKSRDEQFRQCPRAYFYDKYASWGGWVKEAPAETRQAYILKNLKNRFAWKGETVHHVIENVLKSLRAGMPMTEDEALAGLTQTMRRDFRSSKSKKYYNDPKRNVGLFEHEYAKEVSDPTWRAVHDSSAQCLKIFFHSSTYKELCRDDVRSWAVIEDLEDFDFEGAKIFVKLDFARKKGDGFEIYDWKTGKDSEDGLGDKKTDIQMGAYAIYAMQRWNLELSKIRTFLFYVSETGAVPKEKFLSESLIENTKIFMRSSIRSMQALLEDVSKNIPKPRAAFGFTENTRLCSTCNFYKICEKYKEDRPSNLL